jgi:alkylation response protein AidB-like acyl-CoA dehydrogenase
MIKGGSFLFEGSSPDDIFTREDFSEESLMLAETAHRFAVNEVVPRKNEIEAEQTKIECTVELMRRAGELGLLMVEVPEAYGGLGLSLSEGMLVAEAGAKLGSFSTTSICHTGIGTLPVVYFANDELKQRCLPRLASGEWLGAYALTEAQYGSEALGAKTTAVKSDDEQSWVLNGSKIFITNAGFADLFSVYAKVDGEHFSAFVVEADRAGVSTGPEEHKMGIKGSSTRELILDNVEIPADNLLGEVGKGHKVALNILNHGRLKLAFGCLGACKEILRQCLVYATERHQFGKPIGSFQLIQKKLADMALESFAVESMGYRCAGAIDAAVAAIDLPVDDPDYPRRKIACVEEYAVEASMLKVYGSEAEARVADEGVQLHGGYGFIEEYAVCGAYRDSRITRLFEGTSEINRMLVPGTIIRRAMKGQLDLMTPIMGLMAEIKADGISKDPGDGPLGREATAVDLLRRWAIFGLGVPAQKAMADSRFLEDNQILLEQLADLAMDLYAAESCLLRTEKMIAARGEQSCSIPIKLTQIIVYEKLRHGMEIVRQICANTAADNNGEFAKNRRAMQRLAFDYPLDTMRLKAEIAEHMLEREYYSLD